MGQAKEFERLFNEYISQYKKCIKLERARKAMEEKGLPPVIIQQVLNKLLKIIK